MLWLDIRLKMKVSVNVTGFRDFTPTSQLVMREDRREVKWDIRKTEVNGYIVSSMLSQHRMLLNLTHSRFKW